MSTYSNRLQRALQNILQRVSDVEKIKFLRPRPRRRRRRSGLAGAGLSLYARLISHFNITNMVFNYI